MIVAVVGDSISAGSPLWDPDPVVRSRIAAPDERSQWQWWAAQLEPKLEFRTRAVYGKRTDEIAAFLDDVTGDVLVVQGGINDVAQRRSVAKAAHDLATMVDAATVPVLLADVLPWPAGDERAARDIAALNALIREIDAIPLRFHDALVGIDGWSDDGDHPSVEGHRLLGAEAARALSEIEL